MSIGAHGDDPAPCVGGNRSWGATEVTEVESSKEPEWSELPLVMMRGVLGGVCEEKPWENAARRGTAGMDGAASVIPKKSELLSKPRRSTTPAPPDLDLEWSVWWCFLDVEDFRGDSGLSNMVVVVGFFDTLDSVVDGRGDIDSVSFFDGDASAESTHLDKIATSYTLLDQHISLPMELYKMTSYVQ